MQMAPCKQGSKPMMSDNMTHPLFLIEDYDYDCQALHTKPSSANGIGERPKGCLQRPMINMER